MKILFIYTNVNGFHKSCYSPGLAYVVSATIAAGHKAHLLIIRNKNEYSNVLEALDDFKPDVVGFSSVSSQFGIINEIAGSIKARNKDILVVCGGIHPTIYPDCIRDCESLDGIFIGESEVAFVEFLENYGTGANYQKTDNFAYMLEGILVRNTIKPLLTNLDSLPYPDKDVYPYRDAIIEADSAPFFFSRGCPYLCSYCCNHAIAETYGLTRNKTRYRSAASCVDEIEEALSKFAMSSITIRDDIFGINKKWRKAFCKEYQARIGLPFSVFSRVDIATDEYVEDIKKAGCDRVTFAIESGNEYIRNEVMKRSLSTEQIINAFELVKRHELKTTAINLIGLPGETVEMIWDTILLNREINPTTSRANIFYPYRGTILGDRCFKENYVDEAIVDDFSNERRESILKFSAKHKGKLKYTHQHWDDLVYGNLDTLQSI